ncbi:hypothetical protein GGI07_005660 [Coemansia sp. Benny D115]|nr:hypothetical protein GGI07_005660 [Coemansia sp. Benny D115]
MLGQMVVYGSLALYSVGLFWEYRYGKQLTMKQAIWIAVPGIVANIVVGVVVTLLPEKKTIVFVKMLQVCNFNPKFKNAVVTMSWVGGLGVLLVAALWAGYWMRNVPGSRDNRLVRLYSSCVALVVAAVFHTTVFYEKPTYPTNFGWRVAVVSVDQAAALTTWWLVKGVRRSKHLGQVEK